MRILASPGLGMRSVNPYSYLLYSHMGAEVVDLNRRTLFKGKYDVFHLHWPEAELNTLSPSGAFLYLQKKLWIIDFLRSRGTKIVWTVHNLKSHEQKYPRLEAWFWKSFTRRIDAFFALTKAGEEAARKRFPAMEKLPAFVVPHGHYRDEYPNDPNLRSREKLQISLNSRVILSFGQVRPYKNIHQLISVFRKVPDNDLVLIIAGESRMESYVAELRRLAGDDTRIRFVLGRIPVDEVQLYMNSADIVVLPYQDILNSGTALLALSFNRPVLVAARGAMRELATSVGSDWVKTFSGDLSSGALQDGIRWAERISKEDVAPLDMFEWKLIGSTSMDALREICTW